MEPHQRLDVFLPKFRAALLREGLSEGAAEAFCTAIAAREKLAALETVEAYQEAWTAAHAAMGILTKDDDGSEAADWLHAISHRIFDFEDAYEERHGHRPLNAGPPEFTNGPKGTA